MKKLKLDLNGLRIETFDPQPSSRSAQKGTVYGFAGLQGSDLPCDSTGCPQPSDETCGEWTCLLSCERC